MALLEVDGLVTHIELGRRTVHAVDGVSFAIEAGETVGLVGESGCGKTMTGSSLLRLLPDGGRIVSGAIRLAGRDLTQLSEREMQRVRGNDIGMVFQDPMTSLNPTMTIGDQIAEPLLIHGKAEGAAARTRALALLDLVGVPRPAERIGSYPHQLSGGLRQRVVIAIALACEPQLLIADEPTTALDVSIQDQILTLLEKLKRELGMAVLLITHDMGVIAGHADRVLVMYAGQIVESARSGELFHRTRHPYTEALLEALPKIDGSNAESLYTIPGIPPDLTRPVAHCRFAPRCRFAQDDCVARMPQLEGSVAIGDHAYRCFHPRHPEMAAPIAAAAPAASGTKRRGEALVVADHVVKEFPVTTGLFGRRVGSVKAISDVSLTLYRGETLGLVGESGCGKTTLGRMLVALEKPDAGGITVDGKNLFALRGSELRRSRRNAQMIFQDPYASLNPRMRVSTLLAEPMVVQHMFSRAEREQRIAQLLGEVGLAPEAAGLFPREFSGGQRQRIGFARALALEPRLIVADEPVSALDVSIRSQLLNLMRRLQQEHDLTYLMISHDLSVVRYVADRVGVMYLGKLVELGSTADVYGAPAHPYTAGLLDAIPVPDPASARWRERVAVRGELPSAIDPPSGCRFRTRCPRAEEICAEVEPPMREVVGGTSHTTACHFPLEPVAQAAVAAGAT